MKPDKNIQTTELDEAPTPNFSGILKSRCLQRFSNGRFARRPLAIALFALGACTTLCAADSESDKGWHLMEQGDKLIKEKKYANALKKYLEAKEKFAVAQAFGQNIGTANIVMKIGSAYALVGNGAKAINYYSASQMPNVQLAQVEKIVNDMGSTVDESRAGNVLVVFGNALKRCATCRSSLGYWEALANLYRATGEIDKATRADSELAIHREANDAYSKAENKRGSLGFAGVMMAVSAGLSGTMPYIPPPQPRTGPDEYDSEAWHAKMIVYQKHSRPEYVAQTVQEMKNSQ